MKLQTFLAELSSFIKALITRQRKFLAKLVFVLLAMRDRVNFTKYSEVHALS